MNALIVVTSAFALLLGAIEAYANEAGPLEGRGRCIAVGLVTDL